MSAAIRFCDHELPNHLRAYHLRACFLPTLSLPGHSAASMPWVDRASVSIRAAALKRPCTCEQIGYLSCDPCNERLREP
eukprot:6199042-Pleurochrysis_carterae.AAC.7